MTLYHITFSLTHMYYTTLHSHLPTQPNHSNQPPKPPPTTLPPSHTHKPMRFCILPNSFSFLAGSAAGGGGGGGASSLRPPPPLLEPPPMPPRPRGRAAATSLPCAGPASLSALSLQPAKKHKKTNCQKKTKQKSSRVFGRSLPASWHFRRTWAGRAYGEPGGVRRVAGVLLWRRLAPQGQRRSAGGGRHRQRRAQF